MSVVHHKKTALLSFSGFALILIGVASWIVYDDHQFSEQALRTTGIVTGFDSYEQDYEDGSASQTINDPIIQYKAIGKDFTYHRTNKNISNTYELSQQVNMLVSKINPDIARIDNFKERWGIATILYAVSLVPLGGIWLVIKYSKVKSS